MGTPRKYMVDAGWFKDQYLSKLTPTPILAKQIGCCNEHITFLAKSFNLPIRPRQPKSVSSDFLCLDMVEVKRLYLHEMLSCPSIAKIMGCSASAINRRLKAAGVKMRHHNDSKRGVAAQNRIDIDPKVVAQLYAVKFASAKTVADRFGVSRQVIDRILRENGIPKKPIGEARNCWGDKSPNWNPDLSPEERLIRRDAAAQKRWRSKVYARDGYACKKCGDSSGGNLNAHHIIPHCANKDTAWDVDNGITLCSPCHRMFHSTYGLKRCGADDLSEFLS